MTVTFNIIVQVVTLLIGAGILGGVAKLVTWTIRMEPRVTSIETETKAHGSMIQQFTASIAKIEGRLQDGYREDGKQ